ncbi:hypothetical protein SDC9_104483 [bioreactor metagenome]|uniref:Uncharacterized protein n=1 Tax=bioreactor metagenome TaxID=1076179 RepID=A0A645AWW6_9ZZZZ
MRGYRYAVINTQIGLGVVCISVVSTHRNAKRSQIPDCFQGLRHLRCQRHQFQPTATVVIHRFGMIQVNRFIIGIIRIALLTNPRTPGTFGMYS